MPARLLNDGRLVRVLAPRPKIRLSRSRDTNAESAAIQMDKFSFSRFSEKRNYKSNDTSGYDEYVEGVEPEETSSLETHIKESNMGYRLVQKMGWKMGSGLGLGGRGRLEPIPFELKDDNMGLGRWTYEVEQAQDTTDKRNQMETEKEITSDLVEKYKTQAEKEEKLAEMLYEMNKSFYCELCDKQYFKYSEYDNHLNSYDHHHRQRLRDLKQWETGRRFAGHRDGEETKEDKKEKLHASYKMAVEKAHMLRRRVKKNITPGFKPISKGDGEEESTSQLQSAPLSTDRYRVGGVGFKRSNEAEAEKVSVKKSRVSKYGGLKFQSAGNLVTVGDRVHMEEGATRGRGYHDSVKRESNSYPRSLSLIGSATRGRTPPIKTEDRRDQEGAAEDEGSKFSFGFQRNRNLKYRPQGAGPPEEESKKEGTEEVMAPPKLMSRQRELMTKAFGGDSDSEGEGEGEELVKMASRARGTPRFMFQIRK